MIIHDNVLDKLTLGVSSDFATWVFSTNSLFTTNSHLYRSSFDAILNEQGELVLRVFYISDENASPSWQLFQTTTNFTAREDS